MSQPLLAFALDSTHCAPLTHTFDVSILSWPVAVHHKEASTQSTIDNIEIMSSLSNVNLDAIVLLATKTAAAFLE